jgi:heptosyltransferase II
VKILVRAPNWVGDAVMAIPALEAIRRTRIEAEIVILARPAVADTYRGQPFANRILPFESSGRHAGLAGQNALVSELRAERAGLAGQNALVSELRAERFDVALLLQNAFEAAWLAWRAGIPQRIGYARDGRGMFLTQSIPVPKEGEIPHHESQYYLELLRRAGWIDKSNDSPSEIVTVQLVVELSARIAAEAAMLKAGATSGAWRCAIAPGASYGAAKCWPAERFAALADRLISEFGADVILFGTPRESEIATRICSKMHSRAVSMVGRTSTRELPAMMAACSVFIGNDSGAMHVAAAVGLPVIGIFGSTDPTGTAPLTSHFTLIQEHVSCSPCFLRKCPVDHRCMTRIKVDTVFRAAQRLRAATAQSSLGRSQNG